MSERHEVQWSDTPAMRSPMAWALLGLVIEEPSYGHELLQRFRRSYGEALALSSPKHIYRLLDKLRLHELIVETAPRPDEKPAPNRLPKPHYRATEQGMRAYQDWLLMQLEEARERGRLFARQLAMLEPEQALAVIDQYERECLADNEEPAPIDTERESVAERLAEQEEHLGLQVRLSWIEFARSELKLLLGQHRGDGDPR
jgi:DNA-binding PadR family transcriptional regulator